MNITRINFAKTSWEELTSFGNLYYAYCRSKANGIRYKSKTAWYNHAQFIVIPIVQKKILNSTYKFGSYHKFTIKDKKTRQVWVPEFKDKVIQMALTNVITPYLTTLAITDTYACIENRGTQAAVQQVWHHQRRALFNFGQDGVFLKLDISKFFYSIDRDILKQLLSKDILCPKTYDLLCKCIDSFKVTQVGLPLGNVISQHLANYYLNGLDHMIKRELKVKYYVRYADDLFLYLPNKTIAIYVRDKIRDYVRDVLHLTINPVKTYITKIKLTCGLGYKIYTTHCEMLGRNKRRFKYFLRKRQIDSLNSWYGCNRLAKCHGWIYRQLENTDIVFDGRRFYDLRRENDARKRNELRQRDQESRSRASTLVSTEHRGS